MPSDFLSELFPSCGLDDSGIGTSASVGGGVECFWPTPPSTSTSSLAEIDQSPGNFVGGTGVVDVEDVFSEMLFDQDFFSGLAASVVGKGSGGEQQPIDNNGGGSGSAFMLDELQVEEGTTGFDFF
jgi:hypothetical protein